MHQDEILNATSFQSKISLHSPKKQYSSHSLYRSIPPKRNPTFSLSLSLSLSSFLRFTFTKLPSMMHHFEFNCLIACQNSYSTLLLFSLSLLSLSLSPIFFISSLCRFPSPIRFLTISQHDITEYDASHSVH